MYLFIDTETTGLPKNYNAPLSDFENWPRAVQISWACFDESGEFIEKVNHIIFPNGYEIPPEATALHGITTEYAQCNGSLIQGVLEDLSLEIMRADWVVAHNMDYDSSVLGSEFLRAGHSNYFDTADMICTMRASTDFCQIPNPRGSGYKWPKLSELYAILFDGASIDGEHNAEVDALACAKCFFELVKRGVINTRKNDETAIPEPAPEPDKYSELEYSFANAMHALDAFRLNLFEKTEAVIARKINLDAARNKAILENILDGKNAEIREAQAREHFRLNYDELSAFESEERRAKLDFDLAQSALDLLRYRLRLAELTKDKTV